MKVDAFAFNVESFFHNVDCARFNVEKSPFNVHCRGLNVEAGPAEGRPHTQNQEVGSGAACAGAPSAGGGVEEPSVLLACVFTPR